MNLETLQPLATFDRTSSWAHLGTKAVSTTYRRDEQIFAQGDPATAVFCIRKGNVKLTVVSQHGREAVIAILGPGDFFGEACLAGQSLRMSTASAMSDCAVAVVKKAVMLRLLREEPTCSDLFVSHLLSRNIRMEEDLVDQLFNSSEKRLARVLLLLAHSRPDGESELPRINQQTLASIVGTTRSRVSFFMNRFRKLGFISYSRGGLQVHDSLLQLVSGD